MKNRVLLKDKLLCYHGGGYDGCIWEWNFALWDADGKFHDIFSSGCSGLFKAIRTGREDGIAKAWLKSDENNAEVIDLDDPMDVQRFGKKWALPHVAAVVSKVNDIYRADKMSMVCSSCGADFCDGAHLEDWHGCGGIASTADTLLCPECYSDGCCQDCGEYCDAEATSFGLCDYCEQKFFERHPEFSAAVDAVDATIAKGNKQANAMAALRPDKAEVYKQQHAKACAELRAEVQKRFCEICDKEGL